MGIQEPLEGGIANAQFLGSPAARNITLVKALQNSSKTTGETSPVCSPRTAYPMLLSAGPVHSCLDSLPEDSPFQLGISHGDVVEGFSEGEVVSNHGSE